MSKLRAALSFDLDNLWSYLKTHGDAGWSAYPTYLPKLLPEVLDLLARRSLRLTFFVVGRDAARPENAAALAELAPAGHEAGNHSFEHEPWLHTYDRAPHRGRGADGRGGHCRRHGSPPGRLPGAGLQLEPGSARSPGRPRLPL